MAQTNKRQAMLFSLIEVISHNGFSNLKMDDFIRIMQASRTTVYRYFKSREDVIDAVVSEYIEYIKANTLDADHTSIDWLERFEQQIQTTIVFETNIGQPFFSDLQSEFSNQATRLQVALREREDRINAFYTAGQQADAYNNGDISLWFLQDHLMIPELVTPAYLISHNVTVSDALTNYVVMKASQVLRPELLVSFSPAFIQPTILKITRNFATGVWEVHHD